MFLMPSENADEDWQDDTLGGCREHFQDQRKDGLGTLEDG